MRFRDPFVSGYLLDENILPRRRSLHADRFLIRVVLLPCAGRWPAPLTGIIVGRLFDDVPRRVETGRDARSDRPAVVELDDRHPRVFHALQIQARSYVFPTLRRACLLRARAWVALRDRPDDRRNAGA
jgi:hypothetical protein